MATVINNVACSWSMIELTPTSGVSDFNQTMLLDCTAISWNTERKLENIYGIGGQPRKRGFGNVEYTASITLPYGTQAAIRAASPDGTMMGIGEFDLKISWVNELGSDATLNVGGAASNAIEIVTIAGCIFTQGGMEASQDDTSITKEFDLHPFRIFGTKSQTSASQWVELYGADMK